MFNPAFPLAELRPAPCNPQRIGPEAIEQLGKSLTMLGPVKAVIARDDRTIVARHQRTKAMLAAGFTHAPVYLLGDNSDADEVGFNQIHNSADIELGGCRISIRKKLKLIEFPREKVHAALKFEFNLPLPERHAPAAGWISARQGTRRRHDYTKQLAH